MKGKRADLEPCKSAFNSIPALAQASVQSLLQFAMSNEDTEASFLL